MMFRQLLFVCVLLSFGSATAADNEIRITLLGTGGPMPESGIAGTATLVEAGDIHLLFDAGRDVVDRLVSSGVALQNVGPVFLTHFHSDHIMGLPELWSTSWLRRRREALLLIGPVGTQSVADGVLEFFALDRVIRINGPEKLPPGGNAIQVQEFASAGEVYSSDGVVVTAIKVNHGDDAEPAFGYRVDYGDLSVVISGDTTLHPGLVDAAKGSDVFIHEVMAVAEELLAAGRYLGVVKVHATPLQVGQAFAAARPRMAVLNHIIRARQPGFPVASVDEIVAEVREGYDGPVVAGRDLMRITVSSDDISVD